MNWTGPPYADWTWLNGNPRNKDTVWDSKFFTPEVRIDAYFIMDLNHPRDFARISAKTNRACGTPSW